MKKPGPVREPYSLTPMGTLGSLRENETEPLAGADIRHAFGLRRRWEIRCSRASSLPSARRLRLGLAFGCCREHVRYGSRLTVMKKMTLIWAALTAGAVLVSVLPTDAGNAPNAQSNNGLKVVLFSARRNYVTNEQVQLRSTFENDGKVPLLLTFWWNRHLRITDSQGKVVVPEKGPELPCGLAEKPALLGPGETLSRAEPLACTQPLGAKEQVGWSYKLEPGTYRIALVFEAPPSHGYNPAPSEPAKPPRTWWKGKVTSNEVTVIIER